MKRLLLLLLPVSSFFVSHSQLLSWTPPFPQEDNPNQSLVITVDASKGNGGLLNYTPVSDVYVHIGVITNYSATPSEWKYVPFAWGTTSSSANAISLGNNKWQYTITGSLRNFFGITDPNERIQKIAILFRNGNGTKVQRNQDASDMYIPVYGTTLAVRIDQPPFQPKYSPVPETQTWYIGSSFQVTANANKTSSLKLYHNGKLIGSATNSQSVTGNSIVTAYGNQQLVAEANDGSVIKFDTVNIFVSPPGSPIADLPPSVRDGINYEPGDTSAVLVLRAPGKTKVTIIGDFNNWVQNVNYLMNITPDGKFFWLRVHPLIPGTEYAFQYIVDDSIKVADPYVEKVLDPWNDQYIPSSVYPNLKSYPSGQTGIVGVLQTGKPTYNWSVPSFIRPDKKGLVIYELLVRDFVSTHSWKTITDSLNYLKNLGINAIELMPFNEFEGNNSWGYNPSFYFAPDKYYGTEQALKSFIDSCHRRGIAVIMDIALNHSFGQSPMVQLYWDAANNRPSINNPWYNPVPKHPYNVGYDFNHESVDTKYFVSRVMEHWLQKYKIDGYRFDLSKGFTQTQTCDNTGNNCNVNSWSGYDASRIAIWKGYYDSLQLKSAGSYAILEHFAADNEEQVLSDYGMLLWGNMSYNYQEAAMGYISTSSLERGIYSSRGFTKPHLVTYAESHDEERIVYKAENFGLSSGNYNIRDTTTALKRMELDAAFLFTIPGPKMIWQFGEIGYDYSINRCSDGTINDNCRLTEKPIRWDYLNDARRKAVYNTYSKLINLRFHPWYKDVFIGGTLSRDLNGAVKWIKLTSSSDTSDLVVVGNFDVTPQTATITFPGSGIWYDYFNNTTLTPAASGELISLQPGEYRVYVNRNVNNITITPVVDIPWNGTVFQANLFPNPVTSDINIDLKLPVSSKIVIAVYNSIGQYIGLLYSGFLQQGSKVIQLPKPTMTKGPYFMKIEYKNGTKTIPFNLQ
jgi:glycosidase